MPGILCIVIGVAGVSATETAAENGNTGANGAYSLVMMIGFAMSIGYWICLYAWRFGVETMKEAQVACQGVPTPQYIAQELRKEWGRDPSMQEVAAVHTMLANRHNQALVNTGIGLGAMYLMNRNL